MSRKMLPVLVVLMCLIAFSAQAQESEFEVAFGTVVRISANQIVVMEYDFDAEMEKESVYLIDAETQYENVESTAELKSEDSVEILFLDIKIIVRVKSTV